MSLSQCRTYLGARIKEVLPTWKEWGDGFNTENIPANLYGTTFQITYGALSSGPLNDTSIRDNLPIRVELFFKGSKTPKDAIDHAMDTAHLIRKLATHPRNAMNGGNIKNVICTGINVEPVHSSNDNAVKVVLSFTFNLIFSV